MSGYGYGESDYNGGHKSSNGYNGNRNNGYNSNRKNSGGNGKKPITTCKLKKDKYGKEMLVGSHRLYDGRMILFAATAYKDTHAFNNAEGQERFTYVLKIKDAGSGMEDMAPCIYYPREKQVVCKKFNVLIRLKGKSSYNPYYGRLK